MTCPEFGDVENGQVVGPAPPYEVGTTVNVECNEGYAPVTSALTCQSDGSWDGTAQCAGEK